MTWISGLARPIRDLQETDGLSEGLALQSRLQPPDPSTSPAAAAEAITVLDQTDLTTTWAGGHQHAGRYQQWKVPQSDRGTTVPWEEAPDAMMTALRIHDETITEASMPSARWR